MAYIWAYMLKARHVILGGNNVVLRIRYMDNKGLTESRYGTSHVDNEA